jgi:hypothetical protein
MRARLIGAGPGPGSQAGAEAHPDPGLRNVRNPGEPPAVGPLRPNEDMLPYRGTSAGGGYSTVGDLLKFVNALNSHKLLDEHYTELLTTGKVSTPRPGTKIRLRIRGPDDAGWESAFWSWRWRAGDEWQIVGFSGVRLRGYRALKFRSTHGRRCGPIRKRSIGRALAASSTS